MLSIARWIHSLSTRRTGRYYFIDGKLYEMILDTYGTPSLSLHTYLNCNDAVEYIMNETEEVLVYGETEPVALNVRAIGDWAFYGAKNTLAVIVVADTVNSMGTHAFDNDFDA